MGKSSIYKFNRTVDSFIKERNWAIDEIWGLEQIRQYTNEVEQVSKGLIEFKDLGYSKRRESQKPKLFSFENALTRYSLNDENIPQNSIAHLHLNGVMRMEDGLSTRGVRSLCNDIQKCNERSDSISAIIIEVNSGGGDSLAGHFVHTAVKDSKLPVIVWAHFAGSAAMNAIAPADHIFMVSKGSQAGSIGTMASIDIEFIEWYKENYEDIYSSKSPDKNKWFRDYLKGDKKTLVGELDKNVDAFHDNILSFRNLPEDTRDSTLKGGMFFADDAIERGLADSIGGFNDVLNFINNIEDSQTKNFNKMNFKDAYNLVIKGFNNFFGTDFKEETPAKELTDKLSSMGKSFQDAVNKAVTEATTNLNDMVSEFKDQLKVANDNISKLTDEIKTLKENSGGTDEDLQTQINDLNTKITTLTDDNKKLSDEKTELERKVLELTGSSSDDGNSGNSLSGTAKKFADQVNGIEVDGKSKY